MISELRIKDYGPGSQSDVNKKEAKQQKGMLRVSQVLISSYLILYFHLLYMVFHTGGVVAGDGGGGGWGFQRGRENSIHPNGCKISSPVFLASRFFVSTYSVVQLVAELNLYTCPL